MIRPIQAIALLSLLPTGALAAEAPPPDIFNVRFNHVEAPRAHYQGPDANALGYPAALADAPGTEDTEEGRRALMATVSTWLGKAYDGILGKIMGDSPAAVPAPIQLQADPRAYQAAGLKADAQLSALGLNSKVGMRLGTEELKQTVRLSRGCEEDWLPNSVSGDMSGGFGAMTGSVQGSWGSVCGGNQNGWRLTAGVNELGLDPMATIGMEYRPMPGSLIASLTGLSAVRAQVAEAGGSVGLEAPVPAVRVDQMRLKADMNWQENGGTTVKLATKVRF